MSDDKGQSAAPVTALSAAAGGAGGYYGTKKLYRGSKLEGKVLDKLVDKATKETSRTKALSKIPEQAKALRRGLRGAGGLAGALAAGGLAYGAHKALQPKSYSKSASAIGDRVLAAMRDSDRKLGLDKQAYDYVGDEARQALLAHNREELGDAGQVLGGVGGTVAGGLLGAGTGVLAGSKYMGGKGRAAALGALAGGVGGGIAGLLAGPRWGASKAEEATARDVDRLNALADQQYQQQLAQEMERQHRQMQQMPQSYAQALYAPHQYKMSSHIDKMAETEAVPVPVDKDTSVDPPAPRNSFLAPHITGDYGTRQLGVEHSLQRTPALPVDGVTNVLQGR